MPINNSALKVNKVKELKEFTVDTNGSKTILTHYFINSNGEPYKELFYPTQNTNKLPFINECSYNDKTKERLYVKSHSDGKEIKVIEKDIEYLNSTGKIVKKVSEINDGTLTKTLYFFDTLDIAKESKSVYRIHPPTGDTLSVTINNKSAKKQSLINRWKENGNWIIESSETTYDTPTSGTTNNFKNGKLISVYEFGKSKEKNPYEGEPYGLPTPEPHKYKVFTNDDVNFVAAKDTVKCKFVIEISDDFYLGKSAKIYSNKTKLLLKELNWYQNKRRSGKNYEYVFN